MFRIAALAPVSLGALPAWVVAERNAAKMPSLLSPLADSFLDVSAKGVTEELGKACLHGGK